MRKILFVVACATTLFTAGCSNQNKITSTIVGQLDSVKNGALIACVTNLQYTGTEYTDTVKLDAEGKFTYTLTDEHYRDIVFTGMPSEGKKLFEEQFGYFQVTLLPGETVTVTGTLKDAKVSGGKFYEGKAKADLVLEPIVKEFETFRSNLMGKLSAGEDKDAVNKEYMEYYTKWQERYNAAAMEFVKANPDCDYAYALAVGFDGSMKEEAMAVLSEKVKNGPVKEYDAGVTAARKEREERQKAIEEAQKHIAEGKPAPEFTLNDLNGKPLSISSLRGKYVVLDFWGSWCGWCIKGIPQMKEYYKKYDGKFEILGIACGDTEEKWKKAVEDNNLPWLNVINDEKGGTDVSSKYAVTGYPTKIVIDPQGNIAKIVVGESPEFYEYLDKLF